MSSKSIYLIVAMVATVAIVGAYKMREPRGIRNHNPGNIRRGDDWKGMADTQTDKAFIQFEAPEWGIRAMARILKNYRDRHGLVTVPQIIGRWAPPNENDTDSYVKTVLAKLGIPDRYADLQAVDESQYQELIKAIIHHENGKQPYSDELIRQGIALA